MNVAKTLIYLECTFLVLMLLGMLGHRFQVLPFKIAFGGFALSLLCAAVLAVAALIAFGLSFGPMSSASRFPSLGAFILGLVPLLLVVATVGAGFKSPRIHDISTSPGEIVFTHAQSLRKADENSLELPADDVLALQREYYPGLSPINSALSPQEAYRVALGAAKALGWTIVYEDESQWLFEGFEKTALFGFVDDIVVKVLPSADASQVDLRSVSRVGLGDLGANAKRIAKFRGVFERRAAAQN